MQLDICNCRTSVDGNGKLNKKKKRACNKPTSNFRLLFHHHRIIIQHHGRQVHFLPLVGGIRARRCIRQHPEAQAVLRVQRGKVQARRVHVILKSIRSRRRLQILCRAVQELYAWLRIQGLIAHDAALLPLDYPAIKRPCILFVH